MSLKACRRCGETKPLETFPPNTKVNDGRDSWCYGCRREAKRAHRGRLEVRARERSYGLTYDRHARKEKPGAVSRMQAYQAARRKTSEYLVFMSAYNARRRAQKLKATPAWASLEAIESIYAAAKECERVTGEPWHVDHEVPLQHPLVCGLHCETNLRPIPARDNISKGNRYWPDMPE